MKYVLIGVIVLIALAVGSLFYLGQQSQNGAAPGLVEGHLAACPSAPNCVSSEAETPEDKHVDPLPASAWPTLSAVVAEMGGTVTAQEEAYIAAEFVSQTFKFVDDVEFRLAEDAVHVRSGSRVGYSDQGVNRARVEDIRARLGS